MICSWKGASRSFTQGVTNCRTTSAPRRAALTMARTTCRIAPSPVLGRVMVGGPLSKLEIQREGRERVVLSLSHAWVSRIAARGPGGPTRDGGALRRGAPRRNFGLMTLKAGPEIPLGC
jgi:hypothetical protein